MVIDSHHHFWYYNPKRDLWITEDMKVLQNNFTPEDLQPLLERYGIDATIVVQADQSEKETFFLLDLAKNNTFIKGVIGWVNLCSPFLEESLSVLGGNKILKGFRHILQAEEKGFMQQRNFLDGIAKLKDYNFTYDLLIHAGQLPEATRLVSMNPEQSFILDHMAKPDIANKKIKEWREHIQELALRPNIYCKLSGLITEAQWNNWSLSDLTPYLEIVLESFGADRLLFGSDWPVCLLSGEYEDAKKSIEYFVGSLSKTENEAIMGLNAKRIYNINI